MAADGQHEGPPAGPPPARAAGGKVYTSVQKALGLEPFLRDPRRGQEGRRPRGVMPKDKYNPNVWRVQVHTTTKEGRKASQTFGDDYPDPKVAALARDLVVAALVKHAHGQKVATWNFPEAGFLTDEALLEDLSNLPNLKPATFRSFFDTIPALCYWRAAGQRLRQAPARRSGSAAEEPTVNGGGGVSVTEGNAELMRHFAANAPRAPGGTQQDAPSQATTSASGRKRGEAPAATDEPRHVRQRQQDQAPPRPLQPPVQPAESSAQWLQPTAQRLVPPAELMSIPQPARQPAAVPAPPLGQQRAQTMPPAEQLSPVGPAKQVEQLVPLSPGPQAAEPRLLAAEPAAVVQQLAPLQPQQQVQQVQPAATEPALPAVEPALLAAEPALPAAEPALPAAEPGRPAAEPALPAAEPALLAAEPAVVVQQLAPPMALQPQQQVQPPASAQQVQPEAQAQEQQQAQPGQQQLLEPDAPWLQMHLRLLHILPQTPQAVHARLNMPLLSEDLRRTFFIELQHWHAAGDQATLNMVLETLCKRLRGLAHINELKLWHQLQALQPRQHPNPN